MKKVSIFVLGFAFLSISILLAQQTVPEKFKGFYGIWIGQSICDNCRSVSRDDVRLEINEINEKGEVRAVRQIHRFREQVCGVVMGDNIKIADWELKKEDNKLKGTVSGSQGQGTTRTVELSQKPMGGP